MKPGHVVTVKLDRGFGFVRPADGTSDLFFHYTTLVDLAFDNTLLHRDCLFDGEYGPDGRLRARIVTPAR